MRITEDLRDLLNQSVESLRNGFSFPPAGEFGPIELTRPARAQHGDFSTNLPLTLAKTAGVPPRELAEQIVKAIPASPNIDRVEVAGPGFINFFLNRGWLLETLREIALYGESFGKSEAGKGIKVQVEFVSANPTGPLHVGSGRNAAYGDSLARLLEAAGYEVSREFYINDAGGQLRKLTASLEARYLEALGQKSEFPEDGYHGPYLVELAKRLAKQAGSSLVGRPESMARWAVNEILEQHHATLARFGVHFDTWFSETYLHKSGLVDAAVQKIKEGGHTFQGNGATWFGSEDLGNTRNQVLVKSDGSPTYLAVDIAYLLHKVNRGFDRMIYVWGADHHGNVDSLLSAARALELEGRVEILIYQLVTFMSGGKPVRMSRRTGDIITLDELIDEVGVDAARFTLVSRSIDSVIDFDFEQVKAASQDNPVYYVQYSHARLSSILRVASEQGVALSPIESVDLTRLEHESEIALMQRLTEFPETIESAANDRAPHRITNYVQALCASFNGGFYANCRVLGEDAELTQARLWLVKATRTVVANCLSLIGVSAPESM